MKMTKCILMALALMTGAARADALEDQMAEYRDCTEAAMPLLDDGTSDADTIADGLHAQCRIQFEAIANLRQSISRSEWKRILHPHVVQSLLKYRTMKAVRPAGPEYKPVRTTS